MNLTIMARIKTMSELLRDGWLLDNGRLTKPGKVGVEGADFLYLGQQLKLTKYQYGNQPGSYRWKDDRGVSWSRDTVADVLSKINPGKVTLTGRQSAPHKVCTCDIKSLASVGCTCGGFAAEQAHKHERTL